jgi:hypothetical protein
MISLAIEFLGHRQHLLGTILDAKPTSLAAIGNDMYLALGDFDLIGVQWSSPVLHLNLQRRGAVGRRQASLRKNSL